MREIFWLIVDQSQYWLSPFQLAALTFNSSSLSLSIDLNFSLNTTTTRYFLLLLRTFLCLQRLWCSVSRFGSIWFSISISLTVSLSLSLQKPLMLVRLAISAVWVAKSSQSGDETDYTINLPGIYRNARWVAAIQAADMSVGNLMNLFHSIPFHSNSASHVIREPPKIKSYICGRTNYTKPMLLLLL